MMWQIQNKHKEVLLHIAHSYAVEVPAPGYWDAKKYTWVQKVNG